VDSASSLISPILGGNQIQGHALMVSMGAILRKLAIENHLAVLITNHTVGGEFGQPKPALGESWKRIPDVRLLLTHDPSSNACEVAVIKHSSIVSPPQTSACLFSFPDSHPTARWH
jgi:RAD51-like protein 3